MDQPFKSFGPFEAIIVLFLLIGIIVIIADWKIYVKAGKPGWACIIPFYNIVVLCEIVGKPTWWVVLCLIPGVNLVIYIILLNHLSLSFGKDVGFTLGLIFLWFIFYPILGFGDAKYSGPGVGVGNIKVAE